MKTFTGLLLAFSLLLPACSHEKSPRDAVMAADRLISTAPDSALSILEELDTHDADKETQARHALLLAKAHEKTLKRFHNDSLTSLAADYFRGRGDSLEIQSLYYNGVILGYNKDYANALISLIASVEKAKAAGDLFYCAMAYREQADIYRSLLVESKHLEYADSARLYFKAAGKPTHAIGEELSLAEALLSLQRVDSALSVLKAIRNNPEMRDAPAFNASYHRIMADAKISRREYSEAVSHLDSVALYAGELTSAEWSKKARIYCFLGDYSSASQALEEAGVFVFEPNDSAQLNLSEATLAASLGDYHTAYDALTKYHDSYVLTHAPLLSHPYTSIVSNYYKGESDRRNEELLSARRMMWMTIAAAILLVALILALIAFYRRLLREKASQRDTLISDIDHLQKIIDRNKADTEKTVVNKPESVAPPEKASGGRRAPNHYAILNSLCELSSCVPETSDGYALLGKNVSKIISTLRDNDTIADIENFINDYFDNIMKKFREQYPDMTEKNYRFVLLSFGRFSIQSITSILGLKSTGAARTMRHRIKKHIEENPTADSALFLSML